MFVTSVLFGQACGVVRPAVVNSNYSQNGYPHSASLTACATCHENKRPLVPVGLHGFEHTNMQYGGMGDCISCHNLVNNWGVAWTGGQFAHDPQPTSCVSCHSSQRPTTLVGTPSFDHSLNGTGDCFSCHAKNVLKYDTIADFVGGEYMPSELVGPKQLTVAVNTPTFTGSQITKVTASNQTLKIQMLHSTDQLPPGDSGAIPPVAPFIESCTSCHTGAASGNLSGGIFHASITSASIAQPSACIECHSNTLPTGFVGPNDANRTPASGPMRHEAMAWVDDGTGTGSLKRSNTALVTQDCATCHKTPGGSWASAKFHSNLTTQPTSCLDCHSNSRPVGSFGTPVFDHAKYGGTIDCVTCHNVTNFANRTGWANGNYSHVGVTSCTSCHEAQRPVNATGWQNTPRASWSATTTRFDLTKHAVGTDCVTCHKTTTYTALTDFKNAAYHANNTTLPSQCLSCHNYPTGAVGTPATDHATLKTDCAGCHSGAISTFNSITGWANGVGSSSTPPTGKVNADMTLFSFAYWTVNPITLVKSGNVVTSSSKATGVKLPMQILHSSPAVTNLANCATCHKVGFTSQSGTRYHTSIATQPTANCLSCHSPAGVPTGIVGPISTDTSGIANMSHQQTSVTECSTCHTNTGTRWSDGLFHSKVSAATVTACTNCHFPRMPATVTASSTNYTTTTAAVVPMHLSHTSPIVTQDCVSCHTTKGPVAGNSAPWKLAVNKIHTVIANASITACNACHTADKPATTVYYPSATANKRYAHLTQYRGDTDCFTCHTKMALTPWTDITRIGTATGWSGGLYNHQDANGKALTKNGGSCVNCHTGSTGFYKHDNLSKSRMSIEMPCMTCHATAKF